MPTAVKKDLEDLRTDLGLSGAELARQSGVSAATISRIENKMNTGLYLLTAKNILRVLNERWSALYPDQPLLTRDDIDWTIL